MRFMFLALAAAAVGCGSNGAVRVTLTDDPAAASVKQLLVTVNEVRIHDSGEDTATGGDAGATADGATGKGWIVLCSTVQKFDLLQLTNGRTMPLCGNQSITVPTGRVSQLRLGVQSAQLVMDNGGTQDLSVPSGPSSGLKIDVQRDVLKDQTLEVKLDFDANASLVQQGNGSWSLKPVLRVLP